MNTQANRSYKTVLFQWRRRDRLTDSCTSLLHWRHVTILNTLKHNTPTSKLTA